VDEPPEGRDDEDLVEMAEMPPDVVQRSQWGFYSWWLGRPDEPFPEEFVAMAAMMGAKLPPYFSGASFITTGQIITADGAEAILGGESFPWTDRVPMVALDGRLLEFVASKWALDVQVDLGQVHELVVGISDTRIAAAVTYGHNALLEELYYDLSVVDALVSEAVSAGVPIWRDVNPHVSDEAGGSMPVYVMVPATVLEDWARIREESAALVEDTMGSVAEGSLVGIVSTFETEAKARDIQERVLSGPAMVGIAAIGLTAFAMFMAVRTGRVSRGTQVESYYAERA
jgi:hypothetical protein